MKKTYFCSDFHFGIDAAETSKARETLFLKWLTEHTDDMQELYIVGDLFDFWFEYKHVVPKGGMQILAALARLQADGVPVHLFAGNHDQWMFSYFQEELGITVYPDPIYKSLYGKSLMIGHGDGLGPGDHGYKFIKKVFRHPLSRFLFQSIPPGIGIPMAKYWSGASRRKGVIENKFLGEEKEWLIQYCKAHQQQHPTPIDFYIFGHLHLPIDWTLPRGARYINLGDWLQYHSYTTLDEQGLVIQFYQNAAQRLYTNT